MGSQKQHFTIRRLAQNHSFGSVGCTLKHVRVRDHDFGSVLKRLLQRFRYVPGLSHDLHVRFVVQ
jgi:hypothetical protein